MISIHNNHTYKVYGKTHPISRGPMFQHLLRLQAKSYMCPAPASYKDIPGKLTAEQQEAWDSRNNARKVCPQQEQILKSFTTLCAPMICETLMLNGKYKQLQTAILDYTHDEWMDAIYKTLIKVIPWYYFYMLNLFERPIPVQIKEVRLCWLLACIGPRDSFQEQNHIDLLRRIDVVDIASDVDSTPPIVPTDRSTSAFVNKLLRALDQRIPNGYMHTIFQPNFVKIYQEHFGFTSCLDLRRFFETFRGREAELLKWVRQTGPLVPRDREAEIPRNIMPHDIATTFNATTATYMRQNTFKHDRDLSLPQCFDKYQVLNDYYTEEQLEALQEYIEKASDFVLHHLAEEDVEVAVEMLLQDLRCHPHLTFSLKAMKSQQYFPLSHLSKVIMGHSRYVSLRLEHLRFSTTEGENVDFPDLGCAFVLPPGDAIEIDSDGEYDRTHVPPPPPQPPSRLINYEDNSAKSHEIAKRNAHKWVSVSTNAVKDYLQTFEAFRNTGVCLNCIISRRYHYEIKRIVHETSKCSYPNVWEAMSECGLRSVDFTLDRDEEFQRMNLRQLEHVRDKWVESSERKRQAFDNIAEQMPNDSCRNCLFHTRTPKGGFAIMHRTEACRNFNIYPRLFDKKKYPWDNKYTGRRGSREDDE